MLSRSHPPRLAYINVANVYHNFSYNKERALNLSILIYLHPTTIPVSLRDKWNFEQNNSLQAHDLGLINHQLQHL
jgi:hypothetical protein